MTEQVGDDGKPRLRLVDTLLITGASGAVLLLLALALWTSWS